MVTSLSSEVGHTLDNTREQLPGSPLNDSLGTALRPLVAAHDGGPSGLLDVPLRLQSPPESGGCVNRADDTTVAIVDLEVAFSASVFRCGEVAENLLSFGVLEQAEVSGRGR